MGVTIRYRGQLADREKINSLCDDLNQVAAKMQWSYNRLDEDWTKPGDARMVRDERGARIEGHLGLKGISLKPHPQCESISFFFDYRGRLCDPVSMVRINDGTLKPEDVWIIVKTQFAGPKMHMWIVGLLKYIQEHYIPDLEVSDEGEYWETGNFDLLKEKMDFLNTKLDEICGELSRLTGNHLDRLSPEDIASMIEGLLQAKFSFRDGE